MNLLYVSLETIRFQKAKRRLNCRLFLCLRYCVFGGIGDISHPVLDKLVEIVPYVGVVVLCQVVVECLVNVFDDWLDGVADDF